MEKALREKRFQTLLKGLNFVFTILLILTTCIILLFLLILVGAIFTSEQFFMNIIESGKLNISIGFSGLEIFLSNSALNTVNYNKQLIIFLIFSALLYISIIYVIIILVKKFLKSILSGEIFTLTNSKRIEWIAYCIVFLSISIKSIQAYLIYTINEIFNLNALIQNTEWIQSFSYHYFGIHWSMLLCGLVIWTIGRIFRYGSFLQEEFDATV